MDIELLTKFAGFLTERVTDTNRPIIADFLEKFLVVEIKKMEEPDVSGKWHRFLPSASPYTTLAEVVTEIKKEPKKVSEPKSIEVIIPSLEPTRSGNGHKSLKKRDLTDSEKNDIRSFFLNKNGQIENNACVEYKKGMDSEVAIFQVTGFVSYLHLQIACGKLRVHDMSTYLEFIGSHRNLWSTYDSPKYRAMRRKMGIVEEPAGVLTGMSDGIPDPSSTRDISSGVSIDIKELTTPVFALGYKRIKELTTPSFALGYKK